MIFGKILSKAKKERENAEKTHIKCKALCNACEHEHYCADWTNDCRKCEQHASETICKCYEIDNGEKCPYFKPIENEGVKK